MGDKLQYSKLPHFGIRLDADLSEPMSPGQRKEFRQLFLRHHLILAHKQTLQAADRVRLMEYLEIGPVFGGKEDAPVSNVLKGGYLASHELSWHADNSWTPCPVKGIALYGVDLVDGASSTLFCSGSLAWQRLSADERERLLKHKALHVLSKTPDGRPQYEGEPDLPQTVHPLVLQDPHVGPTIYAHYNTTDSIVGLSRPESDALLQHIFNHIYSPEYVYEHVWSLGDFVVWSNIALQHARGKLGAIGRRTLARVMVEEKGVQEMFPDYDFSRYVNS